MDQTPVFFCMTWKKTLEVIGVKTVHIRTLTNDTKRATVAVTIATDGSKFFGGGGDENITINHGCSGSDCGGSGNSDVKSDGDGAAVAAAVAAGAMTAMSDDDDDDDDDDDNDGKGKQGHDDGDGRHDDSKGWHDDDKRQQGDRRHDDGDGRHDDGDGRHDDGDGRHDDGDGRHNDGKAPQPLSVFFATETERITLYFLPGGRRHTRGSNGKVGQSGDRWKGLFKAESFSTSN